MIEATSKCYPSIRLASCGSDQHRAFMKYKEWNVAGMATQPSMLFSYAYENAWIKNLRSGGMHIRNFVLDSGAFTAHSSGKPINIQKYHDAINRYWDIGIEPIEIFSLDVINDGNGSKENTEFLWKRGIKAIPTFHYGEPEELLLGYAKDYPKIALGGAVGLNRKEKERWVGQCFARVWPKPIHGLGFGVWALDKFPFHSIDCSDWFGGAKRFGSWRVFGGANLGLNGQGVLDTIQAEVQHWLEAEVRAWRKWKHIFTPLTWPENFKPR